MRSILPVALAALVTGCMTTPSGPRIADAETRVWWALTSELSSDAMEGRDTGAPGYDRAAALVAQRFQGAGLQPAGDRGYLQPIAMREIRVEPGGTMLTLSSRSPASLLATPARQPTHMPFLHAWTVAPGERLPASVSGEIAFRGVCAAPSLGDVRGRIVVCLNTRRPSAPTAGQQVQAASEAGAAAIVQVDNRHFTVEPPRWPVAYARSVRVADAPASGAGIPVIRWNPDWFGWLIPDNADDLLLAADRGEPVPNLDPPTRLDARFALTSATLSSPNVLAILPGTDPELADEYIVVGAHLDGYGYGEPVGGDRLYNGTFDNAAYVATLIRLAAQRRSRGFRRPILLAAFTGEEKGLIGSRWLVDHLPVPREQIAAMINLDQLRPIFPLELLTVHGLEDSTVGQDARSVAEALGIRVRLDPEPERNLIMRSDHWPFLQAGVPAVNFVFGYEPGTDSERRYRLWYRTRYHHPGDDLTQPWDPVAAAKFNSFFYALVERVANADRRPAFLNGNPYGRR